MDSSCCGVSGIVAPKVLKNCYLDGWFFARVGRLASARWFPIGYGSTSEFLWDIRAACGLPNTEISQKDYLFVRNGGLLVQLFSLTGQKNICQEAVSLRK